MKVTTPIYARAKTMSALLDISVSTFIDLVEKKILPAGKKFQNSKTSVKVWNVEDVCAALEAINNPIQIEIDPFLKGTINATT